MRGSSESPRSAVVAGALSTSAGLDRDDPAVTGIPPRVETIRRARWSASFLVGAVIIVLGAFVDSLGGPAGPLADGGAAAAGIPALALIGGFSLIGIVKGVAAVRVGIRAYGERWVVRMTLLGSIAVPLLMLLAALPVFGFLLALGAMTAALLLAAGGPRGQLPQPPLPAASRVVLSILFALLVVGVVAIGVLHILVWTPIARVPGMTLPEIYGAMSEAGQPAGVEPVSVWAWLFISAGTACAVFCALDGFSGPRSTRRVVVAGTMLVATAASTAWIAGFTAGMSLADTFLAPEGGAAPSGALLNLIGVLGTIVAVFAALAPARWRDPEAANGDPRAAAPGR